MARVLIIDDDEFLRALLRRIVEAEGHEVLDADDGAKGLALVRRHPVDLVITDLVMPGTEGIETIQVLKSDHPGVKVLAISGRGQLGPEDRLIDAELFGADASLAKPFSNEAIAALIRRLLEGEA